ncbi:MAG: sulfite exporter TauE/SafE family protein [SAR324 cluster bacterium]|nr:sulfite exporter TauE/SafE family protein [SAR324 cluster bacterium]
MLLFSPEEIVFMTSVIILGSVVQGLTGFGLALVAAPLLALIQTDFVPGPVIVANLLFTILVTMSDRSGIHLAKLGWATGGRVSGTFLGAWVMIYLSKDGIALFLGIAVLVIVVLNSLGLQIAYTRRNLAIGGLLSGFSATITSIGGPFVALVYQNQSATAIRGNMAGLFLVGSVFALISLYAVDKFNWHELVISAYLIPGVIIGFAFSLLAKKWVAPRFLRPLIQTLCGVSGIMMLFKALL